MLCVTFAVICCFLLCIVLLRRVRKPTSGHVTLVARKLAHGRKEKARTLSFKLSDLPGEVDVEGRPAAQPKVHVKWEEDLSILEDLHCLRRGRRQVVVNLNIGPPQHKVPMTESSGALHCPLAHVLKHAISYSPLTARLEDGAQPGIL